jgi:hypothetical protein
MEYSHSYVGTNEDIYIYIYVCVCVCARARVVYTKKIITKNYINLIQSEDLQCSQPSGNTRP